MIIILTRIIFKVVTKREIATTTYYVGGNLEEKEKHGRPCRKNRHDPEEMGFKVN